MKQEQITTCVTLQNQESTYTYVGAFLQMEKHLPFNFPFASHYFYLQIFEFSWGERALTFSSRRQVFFGKIKGERRENFRQLTARLVL